MWLFYIYMHSFEILARAKETKITFSIVNRRIRCTKTNAIQNFTYTPSARQNKWAKVDRQPQNKYGKGKCIWLQNSNGFRRYLEFITIRYDCGFQLKQAAGIHEAEEKRREREITKNMRNNYHNATELMTRSSLRRLSTIRLRLRIH